jgi:iron complex outermembrane receptor protein
MKFSLISALLGATLLTPVAALAQTTTAQTAPPPAEAETSTLDEVVVTAQRREERLRDVPIAITTVTGEQLQSSGVTGTLDLGQVTPGLTVASSGAFAQPTIRGIGTTSAGAGNDANVAIYVDGVYMASQAGNFFNFNNIERIEVLKGPQGTLFGRNATGGAISITTSTPSFTPSARVSAGYGSFDEITANAYVTGPINRKMAGELALQHTNTDGFVHDVNRDVSLGKLNEFSARAKVLFTATDSLAFMLSGDYTQHDDTIGYATRILDGNTSVVGAVIPSDPRETALNLQPIYDAESRGTSLKTTWDLPHGRLTAINSIRKVNLTVQTDLDRLPVNVSATRFDTSQQTMSHELNYASEQLGRFSFIGGLYYYNDRAKNFNLITNGVAGVEGRLRSEAEAAYFEGNFNLTDRLKITAGARYSTEERHFLAFRPTTNTSIDSKADWSAWTPRIAVNYEATDDLNVYATFSQGFKSGTYNVSTFADLPVDPESVDAFEVGAKYFKRGVMLNVSSFFYDYSDIQVSAINISTGLTSLYNAAAAQIYGADFDLRAPVGDHWIVTAGAAYTHSEYTDFPNAILFARKPAGGNTQTVGDASGNQMVRTPEFTANLGATYTANVFGGDLEVSGNAYFNNGFFWHVDNRIKEPSHTLLNGSMSWQASGSNIRYTVWGKNLTDELVANMVAESTTNDGVSYNAPRSFGVRVSADF